VYVWCDDWSETVARKSKSEKEIVDLLQRFDAILAIVSRVNTPNADKFVELTGQTLKQCRDLLRVSRRPVPLSKVLEGLRQGLRELPLVLQSTFADTSPSDREKLWREIDEVASTDAFLQEQSNKVSKVVQRGVIRNEDEWYLLRWRLDQIEG